MKAQGGKFLAFQVVAKFMHTYFVNKHPSFRLVNLKMSQLRAAIEPIPV
jgi:hypothetical protein